MEGANARALGYLSVDAPIPVDVVAHLFGNRNTDEPPGAVGLRDYNDVKDELRGLHAAITKLDVFEKWDVNPMRLYRGDCKLKLGKSVALEVLSIPAGEAPSERIFSIASKVIKFDQARMGAEQVCAVTFIKKNTRALNIEQ
eukprot:IDg3086t1